MKTKRLTFIALVAGLCAGPLLSWSLASAAASQNPDTTMPQNQALTDRQQAILPIGALTATGDMPRLEEALNHGLDAGLTVNEIKEVLVQMYAYAGFPRSLNALNTFMAVLQQRQTQGLSDPEGPTSGPVPDPAQMLEVGTANQTKLAGSPVSGPLFDFAPAVDEYLKSHLFGAIFARDNLDWQARELATVGALTALEGVESQAQAHMRISLNAGLTEAQLRHAAEVLRSRVSGQAGERASQALKRHLETQ